MLLRVASYAGVAAVVIACSYACTWTAVDRAAMVDGPVDASADTGAARCDGTGHRIRLGKLFCGAGLGDAATIDGPSDG